MAKGKHRKSDQPINRMAVFLSILLIGIVLVGFVRSQLLDEKIVTAATPHVIINLPIQSKELNISEIAKKLPPIPLQELSSPIPNYRKEIKKEVINPELTEEVKQDQVEIKPVPKKKVQQAIPEVKEVKKEKAACSDSFLLNLTSHTKDMACQLKNKFSISSIGGYRPGSKEHGSGRALDLMCSTSSGNEIAEYLMGNRNELNIQHVIWRQRINYGTGWQFMLNRGSATANHYDHIHVLFKR